MSFKLSKRSLKNLEGVENALAHVVKRAIEITTQDFTVTEGLRTKERQAQLVEQGVSWTMNSRHISGTAVDMYPYYNGKVQVNAPHEKFKEIAKAMFAAAEEQNVSIRWGGDWDQDGDSADERKLDMPHYELYP